MRRRSQTTPYGVTHRYYVCAKSPSGCPGVSIIADQAEELVEQAFRKLHDARKVKTRVWQEGSDHSAELEQTKRTIESLREDRAMGLFITPDDEQMFRRQMTALVAKRDELADLPIIRSGWVEVETEETYAEAWPGATAEGRRKMLTDAGVVLTIVRPNERHLYMDYDRVLGVGPSGRELLEADTRRSQALASEWL
jgi:site-specific DNA recombinase